MGFFNICPRNKRYLDFAIKAIPLRVIQSEGIKYTPDFDVQQTDLNGGYKHFKVESGRADSFKISVIIHKKDEVKGQQVGEAFKLPDDVINRLPTYPVVHTEYGDYETLDYASDKMLLDYYETWSVRKLLNYFMRHLTPLMITSNIIGVNNKQLWVITDNKSRKQDYLDYTVWELEFTRYQAVKYSKFKKTTKGVQSAIKNLKKAKKSKKSSKASTKTKLKTALKKCQPKVLVYSKKKKTVKCVKTLQQFLNNNLGTKLVADGWFGNETKKAVIKFQNKYKKKYGCKPNGKVNTLTYNIMIGKAKPINTNKVSAKTKSAKDKLGIKIVKQDMSGFVK